VIKKDIEWRKKIEKRIRNVEKADKDEWKWIMKNNYS